MISGPFVVWHLSISPYSGPTESPNQAHNWVTILKLRVKSQTVITSRVVSELKLVNLSNNGMYRMIQENCPLSLKVDSAYTTFLMDALMLMK